MSGGQAKNLALMQLFANVCNVPVVLPENSGIAVVLGAAMLARFAAEAKGETLSTAASCEKLWDIMVRSVTFDELC